MSHRIRAKFQCSSETKHAYGQPTQRTYKFAATYDDSIPEDERFNKATPSGSLEMVVDNPSARFEVGQSYYLDFTPVDVERATTAPS